MKKQRQFNWENKDGVAVDDGVYKWLSTDPEGDKMPDDAPELSFGLELDTGKAYYKDVDGWHEMTDNPSGAVSYLELINKPKINGVELSGNKGNADLGISNLIEAENNTEVNGYQVPELTKENVENIFNALQSGVPAFITDATGKYTFAVKQVDTNDEDIFVCFDFCDVMILNYQLDVNDDVTISYKAFPEANKKRRK